MGGEAMSLVCMCRGEIEILHLKLFRHELCIDGYQIITGQLKNYI